MTTLYIISAYLAVCFLICATGQDRVNDTFPKNRILGNIFLFVDSLLWPLVAILSVIKFTKGILTKG